MLSSIHSPADVKKLNLEECTRLAAEIREEILRTVSQNGGHLASNLGVVELTIALHRCFDSPRDSIVFDVSHQSYPHKLLTGRWERFSTLRQENGISGFTRPAESEHDLFQTGHSSTSISAALGVAEAKRLQKDDSWTVAVIGDGSLSSGLAYEGMNNAGHSKAKLIVVLNDNKMSISGNVGGIARHLAVIRSRRSYLRFKTGLERTLRRVPLIGLKLRNFVYCVKKFLKNAIYHSNLFEDMGFAYLGPVDGHNQRLLEQVLESAKTSDKPVLVHIITVKGKGYEPAQKHPSRYHSVPPFEPLRGYEGGESNSFSEQFARELTALAEEDPRICAITAAMCEGTALREFRSRYRDRFFDVGIAEEHAVTFAAGLANRGMLPVFAVYSSFLQRSYDELIHDVALQDKPVILAVDRAGLVGADGETHHGVYDVGFLTTVPHITVYSPACYQDLRFALQNAVKKSRGAVAIRYPKGGEAPCFAGDFPACVNEPFTVYAHPDSFATVLCYGREFAEIWKARKTLEKDGKYVTIIKLNQIFPLDFEALHRNCVGSLYFFEEAVNTGSVSALVASRFDEPITRITLPDEFFPHAPVSSLLRRYGLDADSIQEALLKGECSHAG